MNDISQKCSNAQCGCPVQPADVFCPHCGQPVAAGGQTEKVQLGESPGAFAPAGSPVRENDQKAILHPLLAELKDLRPEPKTEVSPMAMPAVEIAGGSPPSDCQDLEVRYNNSCVFVLNMQSTFDFEIRPLVDGIKNLFVEVRQSGQVIARETPMVLPRRGTLISFGLNYTPRNTHAGKVSFTIVVGYRQGDQRKIYAAFRTHTFHSGKENPRQICESLVVEVKNNIQQGHAGDLKVDQNFNGLREALRQHNTIEIDKEFLGLINARPFWTALSLAECEVDSVPGPEPAAGAPGGQQFELRAPDGTRIRILTQPPVRIGRHRDCEMLARVVDETGRELREESLRISQYHAQVEWSGERGRLRDGGQPPHEGWRRSSAGVWVDGKRVVSGGEFTMVAGGEHHVTLGDPGDGAKHFESSVRLWTAGDLPELRPACPDVKRTPETAVCLALRRSGGPGSACLLLRTCALLTWADGRCGHACVCVRQGSLHLSDGHVCERLVPGRFVQAGSLNFQVVDVTTAK